MTETLKRLMDETTDEVGFTPPDLDRIVSSGDRTLRRRRGFLVAGGLAAAVTAGVLAGVGLPGGDDRGVDVATGGATAPISWISDGVLHEGDTEIALGHMAVAYVRNAVGSVFVADDAEIYAVVGDQVERIGTTRLGRAEEQLLLLADPSGTRVAWIDPGRGGRFVSHDLSTGQQTAFGTESGADGLFAADGDTFYVEDDGVATGFDLAAGTSVPVEDLLLDRADILGAGGGLLATTVDGDPSDGDGGGIRVSVPGEEGVVIPDVWSDSVRFSPDAAHVATDADEMQVFDARSGERIALDMGTRPFASVYEWLDDDTVAAIASPPGAQDPEEAAQLITCELATGECVVAVDDLGSFAEILDDDFLLPIGSTIGG